MKDTSYFDRIYFEGGGPRKSNYSSVGGYARHAAGIDWAAIADTIIAKCEASECPEDLWILDIGCAYGHLVGALRARGVQAYGRDVSEFAVSQAAPDVRPFLTVADLRDGIPFTPERFLWDMVCSFDVLEHLESVEEVRNVLYDLAAHSKRQLHKVNTGEYPWQAFEGDSSHKLRLSLVDWRKLAKEIGDEMGCEIEVAI